MSRATYLYMHSRPAPARPGASMTAGRLARRGHAACLPSAPVLPGLEAGSDGQPSHPAV